MIIILYIQFFRDLTHGEGSSMTESIGMEEEQEEDVEWIPGRTKKLGRKRGGGRTGTVAKPMLEGDSGGAANKKAKWRKKKVMSDDGIVEGSSEGAGPSGVRQGGIGKGRGRGRGRGKRRKIGGDVGKGQNKRGGIEKRHKKIVVSSGKGDMMEPMENEFV